MVHQLIERKQAEIRKVHPGLTGFSDTVKRIDIKDIPGICKLRVKMTLVSTTVTQSKIVHELSVGVPYLLE